MSSDEAEATTLSSLCQACGEPVRIAEQQCSPFCRSCCDAMLEIMHHSDDCSWTLRLPFPVSSPVRHYSDKNENNSANYNSETLCCAACQKAIPGQTRTTTTYVIMFCDLCQSAMATTMESISNNDSEKSTETTSLQKQPSPQSPKEEEDVVEVKTMSLANVLEQKFQQANERGEVICMLDDDDDDDSAVLESDKSPASSDDGEVEFLYSSKPLCKEEKQTFQVTQDAETDDRIQHICHQSKYIDV